MQFRALVIIICSTFCLFGAIRIGVTTSNYKLTQITSYPKDQNQVVYNNNLESYLNIVIKQHGYGNGEINRLHYLGSFTTHQRQDELTIYLYIVHKLSKGTALQMIYNHDEYLKVYSNLDSSSDNHNRLRN